MRLWPGEVKLDSLEGEKHDSLEGVEEEVEVVEAVEEEEEEEEKAAGEEAWVSPL